MWVSGNSLKQEKPYAQRSISVCAVKSEQEKTILCILDNPIHTLFQAFTCDRTTGDDVPSVRMYAVQLETL